MIIPDLVDKSAEQLGECRVMIHEEKSYTNLQFQDWGKRLYGGFAEIGVKKGDVIGMCLINNPLVHPIFQGIFRSGAVAVPVMFALTAAEIRFILSDSKAVGIITDQFSIDRVREATQGLKHLKWIAVLDGEDNPDASVPEVGVQTLLKHAPVITYPYISDHDIALILYTAGTTGKPKGVMLTHQNLCFTAQSGIDTLKLDTWNEPPVSVSVLPLAHIFGVGVMTLNLMMPPKLKGAHTVLLTWFEAEQFMKLIQEHKANRIALVPTMIAMILNHPNVHNYDLTSLVDVTSGSSPLPSEQAKAFCKLVDIDRIRDLYGCTECAGAATVTRMEGHHPSGSVGCVVPGMELSIFDKNDNPLSPGEKGEIVVRGPAVMKGYLNNPEATAETLRHGWLHTGDIGTMDQGGYLFIADRIKDMIIKGGENVFPCELEEVMYQHLSIAEAAVIGVPDSVYGESIIAYVVLKQGETVTSEEIIEFMGKKITKFKLPSEICFIETIPKSLVGKILKKELKAINSHLRD